MIKPIRGPGVSDFSKLRAIARKHCWQGFRLEYVDEVGVRHEYLVGWRQHDEARREQPSSLSAPCPHPARRGRHEVYRRSDGSEFCRACGGGVPEDDQRGRQVNEHRRYHLVAEARRVLDSYDAWDRPCECCDVGCDEAPCTCLEGPEMHELADALRGLVEVVQASGAGYRSLGGTASEIRKLLEGMSAHERMDAISMAAICPGCGKDHGKFFEQRGFWSCDCEG